MSTQILTVGEEGLRSHRPDLADFLARPSGKPLRVDMSECPRFDLRDAQFWVGFRTSARKLGLSVSLSGLPDAHLDYLSETRI